MNLLDNLYKEYKDLNIKIEKVKDMILTYGGKIPVALPIPSDDDEFMTLRNVVTKSDDYPYNGSWGERIVFIIKQEGRSMSAKEIAFELQVYETEKTEAQLRVTAAQYCSNMSKGDDATLLVDDSTGRNKYYVK